MWQPLYALLTCRHNPGGGSAALGGQWREGSHCGVSRVGGGGEGMLGGGQHSWVRVEGWAGGGRGGAGGDGVGL